jgi:hypothetical protein
MKPFFALLATKADRRGPALELVRRQVLQRDLLDHVLHGAPPGRRARIGAVGKCVRGLARRPWVPASVRKSVALASASWILETGYYIDDGGRGGEGR